MDPITEIGKKIFKLPEFQSRNRIHRAPVHVDIYDQHEIDVKVLAAAYSRKTTFDDQVKYVTILFDLGYHRDHIAKVFKKPRIWVIQMLSYVTNQVGVDRAICPVFVPEL